MQGGLFSYVLLSALAIALMWAAVTDLRSRTITNELNLTIAFGAPLYWLASGLDPFGVLFQIGLALVTFLIALALFAARQMGGGDVKLLTALSLWFVPSAFVPLIVMMAIIGGGGSVVMALFNMRRRTGEERRDLVSALAAGLFVFACASLAWSLVLGRPVLPDSVAGAIAAGGPLPWILLLALVAVMGIFSFGMKHIMRRQKGPVPVPYGVAIAAAGLWVLADRALLPGIASASMG